MKPTLPAALLETLRQNRQKPPWKCKLQLRHGRTIYGVEISAEGETTSVGGRALYSASDISFSPATIENVTFCAT